MLAVKLLVFCSLGSQWYQDVCWEVRINSDGGVSQFPLPSRLLKKVSTTNMATKMHDDPMDLI